MVMVGGFAGLQRFVPLRDRLTLELKKWRLRCPKGAPENASNVNNRLMKPAVVACGFEREELKRITFHNLRHTFASVALTHLKLPLLEVSKMLGPWSMVVTAKAPTSSRIASTKSSAH
jgi:integrase